MSQFGLSSSDGNFGIASLYNSNDMMHYILMMNVNVE